MGERGKDQSWLQNTKLKDGSGEEYCTYYLRVGKVSMDMFRSSKIV